MINRLARLWKIERVLVKYGLEELFLSASPAAPLRHVFVLSPTRWLHTEERNLARGVRIRRALEELGPVFVKLGQALSTRRDLLPDDIGDELARLQDQVPPFASSAARDVVESSLDDTIENLFAEFDDTPIASASVAQVHGARLADGSDVVVKVLRPDIDKVIKRDVGLMYVLAGIAEALVADGRRLKPREVVQEYERTLEDELDLVREATNAVVLRQNFKDNDKLYIPEVYWDYTRTRVMVQERIEGIPIRDVAAMHEIGMDMKKLAEHAVEIFYTQLFNDNFFHADMHPGNIFVSRERPDHPQFIAVDFGIVGSLTEEDQRYIGENMLAFFQRDYRRVAQLHVDSGWVPRNTRVSELEAAIRAVCEPILDKPLAEISFGTVLVQLFQTARRFEMEVQPQLVLLQKTLLNVEGLGRQLYPQLDLWATGKPYLQRWVMEQRGPRILAKKFLAEAPQLIAALPEMPRLMHEFLRMQNQQSVNQLYGDPADRRRSPSSRPLRYAVAGTGLLVAAALLAAANILSGADQPWWVWVIGALGLIATIRGLIG